MMVGGVGVVVVVVVCRNWCCRWCRRRRKDRPPMVRIATAAEDSATETSILSMY